MPTEPNENDQSETAASPARERLRQYWLQFEEFPGYTPEDNHREYVKRLVDGHRLALDELVAQRAISTPVVGILQEAYEGAIYHIWRSRSAMTCYRMSFTYSPESAETLVKQSSILRWLAEEGAIDPSTLAKARAALEHNLSYYALDEQEETTLNETSGSMRPPPEFGELMLKRTPEVQAAAQFIMDLLMDNDRLDKPEIIRPADPHFSSEEFDADDQPARERLRQCWLHLDRLEPTTEGKRVDHKTRDAWAARHQAALDELVAQGTISAQVGHMVQETYQAIVHYVPSLGMARLAAMCYRIDGMQATWDPFSPIRLIGRVRILSQAAAAGTIKPETLEEVREAIVHDMAAFLIQGMEIQRSSEKIPKVDPGTGELPPERKNILSKWTPEMQVAIKFIMDLLTSK